MNTNAGGPHCLAYGVTSAHVLALDVVLPDGTVARGSAARPAEAAGYDLRGVVVGSEGTLGIVARVCVRLTPLPPAVRTMLLDFDAVERLRRDRVGHHRARRRAGGARDDGPRHHRGGRGFAHAGYPTDAAAILIVEVDGLAGRRRGPGPRGRGRRARDTASARSASPPTTTERALLWKGRKSAFGAVAQIAPHYHLHDCVVPRTKLVEVLAGVYAIAERHDLIVTNVFHAGDGNLHPLLSFDRRVPGTLERVLAAGDEIVRLCVDAGGALSGEHGIGLEKRDFMPLVFTAEDLAAQACVRAAFDPDGRMNPQKVLPAGARCGDFAMTRGSRRRRGRRRACRRARGSDPPALEATTSRTPLREAAAKGPRLLVVGGRTHMDRGNRVEVDAELWTTRLDGSWRTTRRRCSRSSRRGCASASSGGSSPRAARSGRSTRPTTRPSGA